MNTNALLIESILKLSKKIKDLNDVVNNNIVNNKSNDSNPLPALDHNDCLESINKKIDYLSLNDNSLSKKIKKLNESLEQLNAQEIERKKEKNYFVDSDPATLLQITEIKTTVISLLEDYKQELLKIIEDHLRGVTSGRDGVDGKDADTEELRSILGELINKKFVDFENKITLSNDELKELTKESLKLIEDSKKDAENLIADKFRAIQLDINNEIVDQQELLQEQLNGFKSAFEDLPKPKDGINGIDGINGKDADSEAIKNQILKEIEQILENTIEVIHKDLKSYIDSLILKIKVINGKDGKNGKDGESIKGDKGEPGQKGERGNGIRHAKIDDSGDLMLQTDDKIINAGRVSVKKIFGGVGGNVSYTNSKPTPFELGGLKAGTRFKDVDLRQLFTKLLYGWEFPEFTAFSIVNADGKNIVDEGLNKLEVGATLAEGDYSFSFEITNPELLEDNSITIEYMGDTLADKLPNESPTSLYLPEITSNNPLTTQFLISAYDSTGVSFTKSIGLSFSNKVYFGDYGLDITENGYANHLQVLLGQELTNGILDAEYGYKSLESLQLAPGEEIYRWFCYPAAWGENYVFCDVLTDVAILFDEKIELTIKNEFNIEIDYYCFRTVNQIFNEFFMKVKNG